MTDFQKRSRRNSSRKPPRTDLDINTTMERQGRGRKRGQEANKECLIVQIINKIIGHFVCNALCISFIIALQRNIIKFVNVGESLHR